MIRSKSEILVVEIETHRVALAVFRQAQQRLALHYFSEAAVSEKTPAADALRHLASNRSVRKKHFREIIVVAPPRALLLKSSPIPAVEHATLTQLIALEAARQIPIEAGATLWSAFPENPSLNTTRSTLVAIRHDAARDLADLVARTIRPSTRLAPTITALAAQIARATEHNATPIVLVEFASKRVTLAHIEDGQLQIQQLAWLFATSDERNTIRLLADIQRFHAKASTSRGSENPKLIVACDDNSLSNTLKKYFPPTTEWAPEHAGFRALAEESFRDDNNGRPLLNLLPEKWKQHAAFRRRIPKILGAVFAAAALTTAATFFEISEINRLKAAAVVAAEKNASQRSQNAQLRQQLAELEKIEAQIAARDFDSKTHATWRAFLTALDSQMRGIGETTLTALEIVGPIPETLRPQKLRLRGSHKSSQPLTPATAKNISEAIFRSLRETAHVQNLEATSAERANNSTLLFEATLTIAWPEK